MRAFIFSFVFSLTFAIFCLASPVAACDGESAAFDRSWSQEVEPFFASGQTGTFAAHAGGSVFFRIFRNPQARRTLVIFPGYGESTQKYEEWIHDFYVRGYSVYILAHFGMGESGRYSFMTDRQIIHAESFEDYVADAEYFLTEIVARENPDPLYLFAHSTGGLIAAKALARHPGLVRAAVLSAPSFQLNLGWWPRWMASLVASAEIGVGRARRFAPGFRDFDPYQYPFARNHETRNCPRFEKYMDVLKADPSLRMAGPSVRWVKVMLGETTWARLRALAVRLTLPIFIFQADKDYYVLPRAQSYFCSLARDCRIKRFNGSFHEIWRERDFIRDAAQADLDEFFQAH